MVGGRYGLEKGKRRKKAKKNLHLKGVGAINIL